MTNGFNGYQDYPTWVTALWMDNEPASNDFLYYLANRESVHETERVELLDKAGQLEEYVRELILDDQSTGMASDLLKYTLDVIDWVGIIEAHEEIKGESTLTALSQSMGA